MSEFSNLPGGAATSNLKEPRLCTIQEKRIPRGAKTPKKWWWNTAPEATLWRMNKNRGISGKIYLEHKKRGSKWMERGAH